MIQCLKYICIEKGKAIMSITNYRVYLCFYRGFLFVLFYILYRVHLILFVIRNKLLNNIHNGESTIMVKKWHCSQLKEMKMDSQILEMPKG